MKSTNILPFGTAALLLFVGIAAVAGGLGVLLDPSGESLGVSVDLLINSPFKNFLIPGIVLFTIIGLTNLLVSFLTFKQHLLSGGATIILGFIMIIWIVLQVYWIGWLTSLQPTFLIIGFAEIILGYVLHSRNLFYFRKFWNHFNHHNHYI
jgi:hypothetical protein